MTSSLALVLETVDFMSLDGAKASSPKSGEEVINKFQSKQAGQLFRCAPQLPLLAALAVMNIEPLRAFIQSLQEIEHSTQNTQFNLSVKYYGDDFVYSGWPLPRGQYITEKGLRDPGFGSGPVKFEDIEFITVHAVPRRGECNKEYQEKFSTLLSQVQRLAQVMANNHEITYKNS